MGDSLVLLPSLFSRYLYHIGPISQLWIQLLLGFSISLGGLAVYGRLGPFVGVLALGIALIAILTLGKKAEILALDRPNNRYRIYNAFFGLQLGMWQALPSINRVVVKYFSEYSVSSKRSWQVNSPQQCFIVLLSVPAPHRAIIIGKFPVNKEPEALLFANEAAAYLRVSTLVFDQQARI